MSRTIWMGVNGVLVASAFAGGWFAVNAPELARPSLESGASVEIEVAPPPLPPAPFIRTAIDGGEAITPRPLFSAPEPIAVAAARAGGGAANGSGRPPEPIARTLINPPIMALGVLVSEVEEGRLDGRGFAVARTPLLAAPELAGPDRPLLAAARGSDPGFAPDTAPRPAGHPDRRDILSIERRPGEYAASLAPRPRARPERAQTAVAARDGAAEETGGETETGAAVEPAGGEGGEGDAVVAAAAPEQPRDRFLEDPTLMTEEGLILIGVFQSRNSERAIIKKPNGESVRVTTGDEIEGWRVSGISSDHITLRRASQTRMLKLADSGQ